MNEIHIKIPFSREKKLAKAYNEACASVPDSDWILLLDHDVLLSLLPDTIEHLYKYIELYKFADLLTCYSNRNHRVMIDQLLDGKVSNDTDLTHHIEIAKRQRDQLYTVTEITRLFAGFFMLFKKSLWQETKFDESLKNCLSVDVRFSRELQRKKKIVLRMNGIYVWHSYRLTEGINSHKHLI